MSNQAHVDYFNTEFLEWKFSPLKNGLKQDIESNGILSPIVTIQLNNQYFVIDGFKRLSIAKSLNFSTVPYISIVPDIPTFHLIKALHKNQLDSSTILKLRFLKHFDLEINIENLSMLGLPYYSHIKKDINRIMSISAHAQHFLHVKAFSLKEIVNLMHYSMDIFNILLIDDPLFNFTKRTFDDALSMVTALMKRNSQSFSELQLQSNYTTLKDQDLTPQQRQKKWLDQLRYMASPVLHATQKKIDEIISEINVPANISYDRTLENTGISIQTTFTSLTDVERLTTALTDGIVKEQLKHVMDLT